VSVKISLEDLDFRPLVTLPAPMLGKFENDRFWIVIRNDTSAPDRIDERLASPGQVVGVE
jgi:hypothetical protein